MSKLAKLMKRERLFASFVLLIVVLGIFSAFRFGAASLDYYLVRNTLENWQIDARIQTKEEFTRAKEAINNANALHRSNPLYMDLSGQINEWGAVSGFDQLASLERAKIDYLMATKARPLWPVTWANLAMVKWRLQEFDDEMLHYLNNANKLGPQSVEVHILYARLGITLYNAKHPMFTVISDTVRERIRLGLRNQQSKPVILSFVKLTGAIEEVCKWMIITDQYTADRHLPCP